MAARSWSRRRGRPVTGSLRAVCVQGPRGLLRRGSSGYLWIRRVEPCTEWPVGGFVERAWSEGPGTLSSVGGEVVRVQVVVPRALRQAVVPVQEAFRMVNRLQVVVRFVGLRLDQAV